MWQYLLEGFSGSIIGLNVVIPFVQSKLTTSETRVASKSFSTRITIALIALGAALKAGCIAGLFLGHHIEKLLSGFSFLKKLGTILNNN